MSYITRSLEKVVQQVTQEYPVVLVTGPRQVGKTTMLQKLMEGTSRGYVSLDDLNERALAKNDPELFLQLHKPPVLIDEVQYAPEASVYKGYKQDKIEMRGDRAEMSDFPLYLNTVAGGLDRRDQTIGGFSFVVKIYAVPVIEIIG